MKKNLHNRTVPDALIREKLKLLPVDVADRTLHWQQVRQQLHHPANVIPGINNHFFAGLLALIILLAILAYFIRPVPEATVNNRLPAATTTIQNDSSASTGDTQTIVPHISNIQKDTGRDNFHHRADTLQHKALRASPVVVLPAPLPTDSLKSIHSMPDSNGKKEKNNTDSLFIFW